MLVTLAHALWFTDARPPFDWSFAVETLSLLALVAAITGAVAWRIVARLLAAPGPD